MMRDEMRGSNRVEKRLDTKGSKRGDKRRGVDERC